MSEKNDIDIVRKYLSEINSEITSIVTGLKTMNRNWKIIHYVFGISEIIFGTIIATTVLTESLPNIVNGILAVIATVTSAVYIFLNVPRKMSDYSKAITLCIEMIKKFIHLDEQIELDVIDQPRDEWFKLKEEFDKIKLPEISVGYQTKNMPEKFKRTAKPRKPLKR